MNLNAVYELREQLETSAIAGVNLISEDFRLKRAIGQMEPYAKASPVFQKIYGMAQKLILPECEDRAGVLLDTLGLVDAVLCTQGAVQTEGEMEEWETTSSGGDPYFPISHGKLAPVKEAFCGTGGGRYAVIAGAYRETPEIFKDYRMKYWMVRALGDSYAELADMVANWLRQEGESVLPLLKRGFDPGGKREMVRRLQVIEAIGGREENDFYRHMVETGGKEVREAAILALRHDPSNLSLLFDLHKSEKGKLKEAVLQALSYMDEDKAVEFWAAVMKKKPEEAAGYLTHSTKDWASDLIADELERRLEDYVARKKTSAKRADESQDSNEKARAEKEKAEKNKAQQTLTALWNAAQGKHSDKICSCYEKVYRILPKQVPEILTLSLIGEAHPSLCQVAQDMYQAHGDPFLESAFLASLLASPAGETYDRFSGCLNQEGLIQGLSHIFYDEEAGCYRVSETIYTIIEKPSMRQKVRAGFDLRWYPLLLSYPGRHSSGKRKNYNKYRSFYDWTVANLYRPDVEALQKPYGEFFYEGMMQLAFTTEGVQMLKRCGWDKYEGILAAAIQKHSSATYVIRQLMEILPLTNEQLASEIDLFIQETKGKAINGIGLLEKWRDELRSGIAVENL